MFLPEELERFKQAKQFGTIAVAGVGSLQEFIDELIEKIRFERNRSAKLIERKRKVIRELDDLKLTKQLDDLNRGKGL